MQRSGGWLVEVGGAWRHGSGGVHLGLHSVLQLITSFTVSTLYIVALRPLFRSFDPEHISRVLRRLSPISAHFLGHSVKIQFINQMLFDVEDNVERGLFQLGCFKGLDMGKVFSAFVLAEWASCPEKIGFDGVNILFPAATLISNCSLMLFLALVFADTLQVVS